MESTDVNIELVRRLLMSQHPDLASKSVREVGRGWDNALFRVGDDLAARLPIREAGAALVDNEVRYLPDIAPRLPLPISVPVRVGKPAFGYPWRWTIVPWFDGGPAYAEPFDAAVVARQLGGFLAAFAQPAPLDAPINPYRGVPLHERDELARERIARLDDPVVRDAALACWTGALDVPRWDRPAVWVHGDLHPANVVIRDRSVAAVIDFGDLNGGDPGADLAAAWMFFPDKQDRTRFRDAAGPIDDATWSRSRANALAHAVACLSGPADDLRIQAIGRATLDNVLTDFDSES